MKIRYQEIKFIFSGRANLIKEEYYESGNKEISLINKLNKVGPEIENEIAKAIKYYLFHLKFHLSRVEIKFHHGSIEWSGVVNILKVGAIIGGNITLVQFVISAIRRSIDYVLKKHIPRHYRIDTNVEFSSEIKSVLSYLRQGWCFLNRPLIIAAVSFWLLHIMYVHYNMIDTLNKTILHLPYAYTYNYRGATNEHGNRKREVLSNIPIEVGINEEKKFWFMISNKNYRSLKDVYLTLIFPKGVEVEDLAKLKGWIEYQPNEQYSYRFPANFHNGMGQESTALKLKFSTKENYIIKYYISGEDVQRKDREFLIKVD